MRFATIDFEFCPLYFSFFLWVEVTELKTNNGFFGTEGALSRPMTYDNHTIRSHPNHPSHPTLALNELNRPYIDLSRPSMT